MWSKRDHKCTNLIRIHVLVINVCFLQGTFAGIIMGLTQLNCSELKLKRLCYRQGFVG